MNIEEKIIRWAELHCARDNVKWLDSSDPIDVCPMRGVCPLCRELAREAICGVKK
jgi:hypothetical protein